MNITSKSSSQILKYSNIIQNLILPCSAYSIDSSELDHALASRTFESLDWLNLSDAPLSTLCFLHCAPKLRIIDISGCQLLLDQDFIVLKKCIYLEQLYLSFTHVSQSMLTAICKEKPLDVLDACDIPINKDNCEKILRNTKGHITHMSISFKGNKEDFQREIVKVFHDTSIVCRNFVQQ